MNDVRTCLCSDAPELWETRSHQQHATALGILMSKAFHFMEQTDPAKFLERAMAEATSKRPDEEQAAEPTLESPSLPSQLRAAA